MVIDIVCMFYIYLEYMKNFNQSSTMSELYHWYIQQHLDEARRIKNNFQIDFDVKKAMIEAWAKSLKGAPLYIIRKQWHELYQTLLAWCKYRKHAWYTALYEKYKVNFEGIEISSEWAIIIDNKIFEKNSHGWYTLEAIHNGINTFSGDFVDKDGNTWIPWITYMISDAANEQAVDQWKKLFATPKEVDDFIQLFPWDTQSNKILSFSILFQLEFSGHWCWVGEGRHTSYIGNGWSIWLCSAKMRNDFVWRSSIKNDSMKDQIYSLDFSESNGRLKFDNNFPIPYIAFKELPN